MTSTTPESLTQRAAEMGYTILKHDEIVVTGSNRQMRRMTVEKEGLRLSLQVIERPSTEHVLFTGEVMNEDDFEDETFDSLCSIGPSSEAAMLTLLSELP